jgi:Holliday junction resolvase
MSGKKSRNKGSRGERELFKLLNALMGRQAFKRNLAQSRAGGCDIQDAGVIALEVKRDQRMSLPAMIRQAQGQARPGQIPALAYRRNGEQWQFLVILDAKDFVNVYELIEGTH